MIFAGILPIFLVIFFTILQDVKIRIRRQRVISVRIDFTLLSITFTENPLDKNSFRSGLRFIKNLPFILKALNFAVKKSKVTIFDHEQSTITDLLARPIMGIPLLISAGAFSTYIRSTAKSLVVLKKHSDEETASGISTDIVFETKLINLINSSLLFLYYKAKSKIGRIVKNV